ncbi:unnamed protein product [Caenorhabditis bovis]|uniref:Uncharacterized protein n=1 Tax=Caenorhabditis bovis TaxID=2654633 RepID=A0A8S1EBQ2_9PELO|nr:unnamed protein product [Caenorhabditis bovis]
MDSFNCGGTPYQNGDTQTLGNSGVVYKMNNDPNNLSYQESRKPHDMSSLYMLQMSPPPLRIQYDNATESPPRRGRKPSRNTKTERAKKPTASQSRRTANVHNEQLSDPLVPSGQVARQPQVRQGANRRSAKVVNQDNKAVRTAVPRSNAKQRAPQRRPISNLKWVKTPPEKNNINETYGQKTQSRDPFNNQNRPDFTSQNIAINKTNSRDVTIENDEEFTEVSFIEYANDQPKIVYRTPTYASYLRQKAGGSTHNSNSQINSQTTQNTDHLNSQNRPDVISQNNAVNGSNIQTIASMENTNSLGRPTVTYETPAVASRCQQKTEDALNLVGASQYSFGHPTITYETPANANYYQQRTISSNSRSVTGHSKAINGPNSQAKASMKNAGVTNQEKNSQYSFGHPTVTYETPAVVHYNQQRTVASTPLLYSYSQMNGQMVENMEPLNSQNHPGITGQNNAINQANSHVMASIKNKEPLNLVGVSQYSFDHRTITYETPTNGNYYQQRTIASTPLTQSNTQQNYIGEKLPKLTMAQTKVDQNPFPEDFLEGDISEMVPTKEDSGKGAVSISNETSSEKLCSSSVSQTPGIENFDPFADGFGTEPCFEEVMSDFNEMQVKPPVWNSTPTNMRDNQVSVPSSNVIGPTSNFEKNSTEDKSVETPILNSNLSNAVSCHSSSLSQELRNGMNVLDPVYGDLSAPTWYTNAPVNAASIETGAMDNNQQVPSMLNQNGSNQEQQSLGTDDNSKIDDTPSLLNLNVPLAVDYYTGIELDGKALQTGKEQFTPNSEQGMCYAEPQNFARSNQYIHNVLIQPVGIPKKDDSCTVPSSTLRGPPSLNKTCQMNGLNTNQSTKLASAKNEAFKNKEKFTPNGSPVRYVKDENGVVRRLKIKRSNSAAQSHSIKKKKRNEDA